MNTNLTLKPRVISVDILRGIVMILMALDHVRHFFGTEAYEPENLEFASGPLFFTRWITHFCAPVFLFLAGTSAFLYRQNTRCSTRHLSKFLFTRGLWIIFIEIFIWNLIVQWIPYQALFLQVLWAIGWSMVILSALVYLPPRWILAAGLLLIFGHNTLDGIKAESLGFWEPFWAFLHQYHSMTIFDAPVVFFYPIIPWVGVMAVGFVFGRLLTVPERQRNRWFLIIGGAAVVLFILLRGLNIYGDPEPWTTQERGPFYTFLSVLNTEKYPPSLLYLLMTLGPAILLLGRLEKWSGPMATFCTAFGKVPFFFYLLHFAVIHITNVIWSGWLFGDTSNWWLGPPSGFPSGYQHSLSLVYFVWVLLIIALYPACRWYMNYKKVNKGHWWLSYL